MSNLITTVEQATPAWLTSVLNRAGYLPWGEARSLAVTRIHDEQLLSVSYFLSATYDSAAPPDAPTRLFLKLPRQPDDASNVSSSSGAREVRMYQLLAADQRKLPVVPCYDAVYDRDRRRYHLLLADLSESHDQPAWHLSIADHYVTRTIDCLARFHAYWWGRPRLDKDMGELPGPAQVTAEIERLQQSFAGFADVLGDRLSRDDRHVYEQVLAALPRLWADRAVPRGKTMEHGDAHFWNFLYPRTSEAEHTYIVDWQAYHLAPGAKDIAYLLVLRYPHRTPANERLLVERYHAELLRHGVEKYRWDACWYDYRRLATEQLLFPLAWWIGNAPESFWSLFVDRALAGFRDLACAEFV